MYIQQIGRRYGPLVLVLAIVLNRSYKMSTLALRSTPAFVRTRSTWLGYALLACFGFALSLPGPTMPFLAAKFNLTFTEIGYHFTLMSAGIVLISLIGDRIAKRIG